MNKMIVAVVAVAVLGFGKAASAEVYWSANAASCVPTNTSIQTNSYTVSGGAVVASNNTVLYCPVLEKGWNSIGYFPGRLVLNYKGQSSGIYASGVKAELVKLDSSTGAESVVATATSTTTYSTPNTVPSGLFGSYTWLFGNTVYYYVRITMYPGNQAGNTETMYGVWLDDTTSG